MFKRLRALIAGKPVAPPQPSVALTEPPSAVVALGVGDFDVASHLIDANGLPVLNWAAVQQWVARIPDPHAQAAAWTSCETAWLEHLRVALGPGYALVVKDGVALLSSLDAHVAVATIAFVAKTRQRIVRILDGIAQPPAWGHNILVVFDADEAYYPYVAHYYPQGGEFAASGGMFIHAGCGHFVTVKADLRAIEPVIAHELTHACLSHLPLPVWLNEGLAVNTEHRLCPPPSGAFGGRPTPQQMQLRHQQFWKAQDIQEFWSGQSFLRADDGNELSYDLARIMVSQFAGNWEAFSSFVLTADSEDAGAAAAQRHLGVDLGQVVCALLAQTFDASFAPTPLSWRGTPARGAFDARIGGTDQGCNVKLDEPPYDARFIKDNLLHF